MFRSIFFATGLFVTLWGVTFLFVESVTFSSREGGVRAQGFRGLFVAPNAQRQKVFNPPEWASFSLMSVGVVTMLYSLVLPKKQPPQ